MRLYGCELRMYYGCVAHCSCGIPNIEGLCRKVSLTLLPVHGINDENTDILCILKLYLAQVMHFLFVFTFYFIRMFVCIAHMRKSEESLQ